MAGGTRKERDSMGEMEVPADAYYGATTQRAVLNFPVSGLRFPRRFVRALEFRANTKVIHHVFLRFDRSQQSRRLDAQDAETGFGGMTVPPGLESDQRTWRIGILKPDKRYRHSTLIWK